jgi:hypothetical protein
MGLSKRVTGRISSELKRYQPILSDAKRRDISEADTVVIVGDMLADVLGYNKIRKSPANLLSAEPMWIWLFELRMSFASWLK